MKTEIENFMTNYDQKYKIFHFEGYDDSFEDFVKKEIGFKIYFLDIKTKCKSGLDAARIIREKYDDWVSIIGISATAGVVSILTSVAGLPEVESEEE